MRNRRLALSGMLAFVLLVAPIAVLQPAVWAQQAPSGGSQPSAESAADSTTIEVQKTETWYANPTWIVLGLLALALIVGLVVAAGRGRNTTTIIKD